MAKKGKPIVFIACANSDKEGKKLPALQKEREEIRKLISPLENLEHCELISEGHTDETRFFDILKKSTNKKRIQIIHFAGHADDSFLRFISTEGNEQMKSIKELCEDMQGLDALKIVFLNGCATKNFVEGLLANGVPAVLATSRKIADPVALEFSISFYEGMITESLSVKDSFIRAKRLVHKQHGFSEEFVKIQKVEAKQGSKVEIAQEILYRASKRKKAERDQEEKDRKEFAWNLYHRSDTEDESNSALAWVFVSKENLGLNQESHKVLAEKLSVLQAENESLKKQAKGERKLIERQLELKEEIAALQAELDEMLEDKKITQDEKDGLSLSDAGSPKKLRQFRKEYDDILAEIQQDIDKKTSDINTLKEELDKLSGAANKEVLKQGLMGLNFTQQTTLYSGQKGGLKDSYLNLVLVRGAEDHGTDLLIKVIKKISLLNKPPSKSIVLDFGGDLYEPDERNIWDLTGEALANEHGKINRSPSSKKYPASEVCKNLANLLKTGHVIIRWEDILEEMIAEDFIPIVNAFWTKLLTQFPKEPPKHRLFVFLIDRMASQPVEESKIYNAAKYASDRKSFFSLPKIEPVKREEIIQWFNRLKEKQDYEASEIDKISAEYDFFVAENDPQPIEPVVSEICDAFNYSDLADNLLK